MAARSCVICTLARVEYRVIATTGKGERIDRPEIAKIEAMIRTGELDLLVCEDIGRMIRGAHAVRLCGIAVDHGTRVLAPHDDIDTNRDSWEEDVLAACRDHVSHNTHTSRRLKSKLMNRFIKFGGATAREIFGYVVPDDAETYDDWKLDAPVIPIFQEWFRRLRENPNASTLADWLNELGVPTGPYCRNDRWDSGMVRRITRNTLLKSMPERGRRHTIKNYESGRRVSVINPDGPKVYLAPHLTIINPDEFDEVNAILDAANKGQGRKPKNGVDPLFQVSRKRSRFPGQIARCAYCGREYVWGGNGVTESLQCSGSRTWNCWNSVGFNGRLAADRIVEVIRSELYRLDGFDAQFSAMVAASLQQNGGTTSKAAELKLRSEELARQKRNLVDILKQHGTSSPTLLEAIAEIDASAMTLARESRLLESRRSAPLNLPGSIQELRAQFEKSFATLAVNSYEFADRLRPLIREFDVWLVRLIGGGKPAFSRSPTARFFRDRSRSEIGGPG